MEAKGKIVWVSGPAVKADGMSSAKMYETVEVGSTKLIGEVIRVTGDVAFIQVYESTSGLKPGEPVKGTGQPLSVLLGPGVIGKIYDGIQRPLDEIAQKSGSFIGRGVATTPVDMKKKYKFSPAVKVGDEIVGGSVLGFVEETPLLTHSILAPPDHPRGKIIDAAKENTYEIGQVVVTTENNGNRLELKMFHKWPVRKPRPYAERFDPSVPLITGQRIIDTYFPIAKGGTGAIPGGFGTGKTVTLHQIAKWADSKVVVYIGCGERGNEMTEVLVEFPHLLDPHSGRPLMERTVLVANTSNMPVAAREASIYTGVTIAEFYERAGRVRSLGLPERSGSVTLIGAVSPSGADFTEPVTTHTIRFIKTFWALDTRLAYSRHYPSINWMQSYSGYLDDVSKWWTNNVSADWYDLRAESYHILQREDTLKEIVRLLGPEALPDEEKLVLEVARMIKIGILQQNSFDKVDTYCSPQKQVKLVKLMVRFYKEALKALREGTPLADIRAMPVISSLLKAKFEIPDEEVQHLDSLENEMIEQFKKLQSKEEVKVVV